MPSAHSFDQGHDDIQGKDEEMTRDYKDIHHDVDEATADARDLLSALYEIGIEHHFLGSSDREAMMFMTLIKLALEKVRAVEKAHGIEYQYVSPQLRTLEVAA